MAAGILKEINRRVTWNIVLLQDVFQEDDYEYSSQVWLGHVAGIVLNFNQIKGSFVIRDLGSRRD